MVQRRSLMEGVRQPTPEEQAFIDGRVGQPPKRPEHSAATKLPVPPAGTRSPLSTRIRADYAEALKRASLERQLAKIEPNTISDILEVALEPWLKSNNHLA